MAYDKKKIFKMAKEVVKTNNCFFIEHVITFLPISKTTFYEFYPLGSDELDEIKAVIDDNKVNRKALMQNKWFESENATLQVALYKLLGTNEELQALNGQYIDHTTKGDKINNEPDYTKLSDDVLKAIKNAK